MQDRIFCILGPREKTLSIFQTGLTLCVILNCLKYHSLRSRLTLTVWIIRVPRGLTLGQMSKIQKTLQIRIFNRFKIRFLKKNSETRGKSNRN